MSRVNKARAGALGLVEDERLRAAGDLFVLEKVDGSWSAACMAEDRDKNIILPLYAVIVCWICSLMMWLHLI